MRDWIAVGHFDSTGSKLRRVEPFLPDHEFSHPMDMIIASDGSLYLLEYGQKWYQRNLDARLNRISYVPEGTVSVSPELTGKSRIRKNIPEGQFLAETSGCLACHDVEALVNGPSFKQIAERYSAQDRDYLADKIAKGGGGAWGERPMPPQPRVPMGDLDQIVGWILSFDPANQPREH